MGYIELNRVEQLVDRLVCLQTMRKDVTSSDIANWIQEICSKDGFQCTSTNDFMNAASNYRNSIEQVLIIKRNSETRYVKIKKSYDGVTFNGFDVSATLLVSEFKKCVECNPRPDDDMSKSNIRNMLFHSFGVECPPSQ